MFGRALCQVEGTLSSLAQGCRSFQVKLVRFLSQSNIHQFPLIPRLSIRFNQPLCEFLEFDVTGAMNLLVTHSNLSSYTHRYKISSS
jgi:hypothetical protein